MVQPFVLEDTKLKVDKPNFIKIKIFAFWKTMLGDWKDKPQIGRKYLQITYLKRTFNNNIQRTSKTQQSENNSI